jgi:hypothetical protein
MVLTVDPGSGAAASSGERASVRKGENSGHYEEA